MSFIPPLIRRRSFFALLLLVLIFVGTTTLASRSFLGRDGGDPISEKKIEEVFQRRLRGVPKTQAKPLAKHLIALSKKYGFDPVFLLAVIYVESGFQVDAVSGKNALGLMQVKTGAAREVLLQTSFKLPSNADLALRLKDPFFNLSVGVAYLAWLRDRFPNHPSHYLVAYNAGPTLWDRLLTEGKEKTRFSRDFLNSLDRSFELIQKEI